MLPFLPGNFIWSALSLLVSGPDVCNLKMAEERLIPNYIDVGTAGNLQLMYGENDTVECGGEMQLASTFFSPTVTYDVPLECYNVSVIAFDPDTPLPCEERIFLHWFAVNIPADVMRTGYRQGQAGYAVSPYMAPGTTLGAQFDNHRYTFCVHCQDSYIAEKHEMDFPTSRMGVHPKSIAEKYGLGDALACTFYYLAALHLPANADVLKAWRDFGNRDVTFSC